MIIQSTPASQSHFVIRQTDHARLSGAFARAFGNEQFAPLHPAEPIIFAVAHHDEGWQQTDEAVLPDVNTGLPYHLTQTPLPELIKTSSRSPQFNEQHHPYSGILSSMHTYGLYNGRYGLSDKVFVNLVPAEHKTAVLTMLNEELARQERLKAVLRQQAETAVWVQDDVLFHNYKLLQFFDTLALYFHMTSPQARGESHFLNVPQAVGQDVTVTIRPAGDNRYQLTPYPFRQPAMTFSYVGRYLTPQPPGTDLRVYMNQIEPEQETLVLI